MYIDVISRLRDAIRRKSPKNGEPTAGLSFTVMLQHTGRFFRYYLSKEQFDALYSILPNILLIYLKLICTCSLD
jgi:L-asparagine transporter-like permease